MKKIISNIFIIIIACASLVTFGYASFNIFFEERNYRISQKAQDELATMIEEEDILDTDQPEKVDLITRFEQMNSDFVFYFKFDSKLIAQPVVQTDDNSYYLNHSFKNKYDQVGTIFMDKDSKMSDDNITIYGHYVYNNTRLMFSPLTLLTNQANYNQNYSFTLTTADRVKTYHIVYVYHFNIDIRNDYDYTKSNFHSEEEFNQFLQYPKEHNMITPYDIITYGDSLVTMQTCVRNKDNQRLVVVAKLISEEARVKEEPANE